MKISLVKIGNSRGIRLPKAILDQCNFEGDLEVEVKDGKLILSSVKVDNPRKGWAASFKAMAKAGDDKLLDEETSLSSDEKEWKW